MLQRSCLDIQTRTGARADQEHWSSRIQDPVDLQVEKLRGADWAATAAVTVAATSEEDEQQFSRCTGKYG